MGKIRNVSGENRSVPGLGGRLVMAGQTVDCPDDEVWSYTCQEGIWTAGDEDSERLTKAGQNEMERVINGSLVEPEAPALNASKDAWAEYAVQQNVLTQEDAESHTRDELIALVRGEAV